MRCTAATPSSLPVRRWDCWSTSAISISPSSTEGRRPPAIRAFSSEADAGSHSNQVCADCVDLSALENASKQEFRDSVLISIRTEALEHDGLELNRLAASSEALTTSCPGRSAAPSPTRSRASSTRYGRYTAGPNTKLRKQPHAK